MAGMPTTAETICDNKEAELIFRYWFHTLNKTRKESYSGSTNKPSRLFLLSGQLFLQTRFPPLCISKIKYYRLAKRTKIKPERRSAIRISSVHQTGRTKYEYHHELVCSLRIHILFQTAPHGDMVFSDYSFFTFCPSYFSCPVYLVVSK
jgi:hypothetical protein